MIYSGISDVGLKRKINQDAIFFSSDKGEKLYLFVVADGMGGHFNGEVASQAIVAGMRNWLDDFSKDHYDAKEFSGIMVSLRNKLEQINDEIYSKYNQQHICGSTCVILVIYQNMYGVISVGDSRVYLKRGLKVKSLMEDDVWENQIGIRENMDIRIIKTHPNYGKLVHAVGINKDVSISVKTDSLRPKDTFLLCSDGLYKYCEFKRMKKAMASVKKSNLEKQLHGLVEDVYKQGAKDNISIIMSKVIKDKENG